jgi:hypothetical protein
MFLSWLAWFWDKIAGNLLFWIMLLIGSFILNRIIPSLRRTWQRFRRKDVPATSVTTNKVPILETASIWFLVLAIVLLALWNRKLEHESRTLRVEMIRYVLPRQLTKEQTDAFGKYLSSHSQPNEVRIKYILGDAEAERYGEAFASAFRAGNWLPNMMPVNPMAITCHANPQGSAEPFACTSELQQMVNHLEGVSIQQSGPNPPQPSTLEEKVHPPPYLNQIVSEALKAAGIQGIGGGYGNNNDPLNTITVYVGIRPRDKWAVVPPNFFQRRNVPQDIGDDDFK